MRSSGPTDKTVAILGAGIQGTCAALALAARGCRVDLFDQAPQPVTQASLWNEGKIHLGFTYAKDRDRRTTDVMLRGALHFEDGLRRLTGRARPGGLVSTPFRYLVHRTSQLSVEAVAAHFDAVAERYRAMRAATGLRYLGHESEFVWERMADSAWRADYDERETLAAFRTMELSVDPMVVAQMLRGAIAEQHRIRFHPNSRVERVDIDPSGAPMVVIQGEGALGPYNHVINALWQNRLRVDAGAGMPPDRPWLHRYKLAIHVTGAGGPALPSTTIVLGEYGDIVEFGGGRRYLSWYPACKLAEWTDLQPPDISPKIDDARRQVVLDATVRALTEIVPSLRALDLVKASARVEGGYIFAWGRTDIADPDSELHGRSDIGIRSRGRFHSIDTGKYGMAPYFADQLADRLCGEAGRSLSVETIAAS
jgi:glycine/D-amino acid oxidase-like deaminating enzyme